MSGAAGSVRAARTTSGLDLESLLGDPADDGALTFARLVADEDRSREEHCSAVLSRARVASALVPAELGGEASGAARIVRELRPLSRRDPSLAVDLMVAPLAAASVVWAVGDPSQQVAFAASLLSGARVAGNLTGDAPLRMSAAGAVVDRESPLMAGTRDADVWAMPFRDDGGGVGLVICRDSALAHTPPRSVETVGLRGTRFATRDLGGFRPGTADIIRGGDAAIMASATRQTRVVTAALAVATVDTALQLAMSYALGRELYRGTVLDIPHARGLLAEARTDLITADAITIDAIDALDQGRADADAVAEAATTLVPLLLNDAMRALSVLFGSTFYARVEPYAIFETLVRDVGSLSLLGLAGSPSPGDIVGATRRAHVSCHAVAQRADVAAADDDWLTCATARMDARVSRRRVVLSQTAVDVAIEDVSNCMLRRTSSTLDRAPLFGASPMPPTPHESRSST